MPPLGHGDPATNVAGSSRARKRSISCPVACVEHADVCPRILIVQLWVSHECHRLARSPATSSLRD